MIIDDNNSNMFYIFVFEKRSVLITIILFIMRVDFLMRMQFRKKKTDASKE